MEALMLLFSLALLVTVIVGAICGIIALRKVSLLGQELRMLRGEVEGDRIERRVRKAASRAEDEPVSPSRPPVEPQLYTPPVTDAADSPPPAEPADIPPDEPPPSPPIPPSSPERPHPSLEFILGTRWFVWVGVVLLLISAVLFVKYAYDNAWVGPHGRLAMGTVAGVVALLLGQRFRRREWPVLFQSLTGCGIGLFYICIYAAFALFGLTGQTTAMALAVLVTVLAVVLAVAHNAVSIAIIGLIGGFLSPLLLSTGENRPYAFFTYVAVLGLTAIGAAIYRRWRALDLLAFAGTVILFQLWFGHHYDAGQMAPALLFVTLFYLIYLLVPLLHTLIRRTPSAVEGLTLVGVNALWSAIAYYRILHQDHHQALGFVILGQALLVFVLFQLCRTRVPEDRRTAESLLIITLGLVTAAIPIQLRLYGIPVAWGLEGLLLAWLGIRYNRLTCRLGAVAALLLATGGLIHRLPLHSALFTPVVNIPFGSWALVIACAAGVGWLYHRRDALPDASPLYGTAFLLAAGLTCGLLTMEVAQYWNWHRVDGFRVYQASSLTLLWALLPLTAVWVLRRERWRPAMPFAWLLYAVGLLVALLGLDQLTRADGWLLFNTAFLARLALVLALWLGARLAGASAVVPRIGEALESLGHGFLAITLAIEVVRWADHAAWVSDRLGISLISATLALQAFALIWLGLATRVKLRRIIGFILFGICVVKVVVVDTATLREVYRITSFLASGLLLIAAAYFYQRYAPMLLGTDEDGGEPGEDRSTGEEGR
jgi:uncharacterized membrane protein